MKKEYSITLKQQFLVASSGLIKYFGLLMIYIYFYGLQLQPTFIYLAVFFLVFDILPALALHLQYLHENSGALLVIDKLGQRILYKKRQIIIDQSISDIVSFELISSYGGGRYNAGWYAFGEYRYCRVIFKDSSKAIITCLMVNDIQNTLENLLGISYKRKLKVFPFINSH